MNCVARKKEFVLAMALAAVAALAMTPVAVFAHGGEDHGDEKKAPAVAAGAGMVSRVARVGDLEVVIKHPPLEPDKETTARVFVTRFDSNEPVGGAKIVVAFAGDGSAPAEATAAPGNTPGLYEVKLPPLPRGQYKLNARVEIAGTSQTAQYGALEVAPLPPPATANESSWARTALMALALLAGLGLAGVVIYRAAQYARRDRIKEEAATA